MIIDSILEVLHLLLIVLEFVTNKSQFTLLLHSFVDFHSQLCLVFLLNGLNVLPSLVLDLLAILLVTLNHLLNLLRQGLLLSFKLLALQDLVTTEFLHEVFMCQISLGHEILELGQIVLFLLLELLVAVLVSLTLLLLLRLLLLQQLSMGLHLMVDLLLVATLQIPSVLFDFVHGLATFCLLFFHLAAEVLSFLLVLEHEGSLPFLSVTLLSLDRLLQVTDLLLKLVSLLLLDQDLLGECGQLTLVFLLIFDCEDGQCAISTSRVQELVVVADANTGDHL